MLPDLDQAPMEQDQVMRSVINLDPQQLNPASLFLLSFLQF